MTDEMVRYGERLINGFERTILPSAPRSSIKNNKSPTKNER